MLYDYECSDCEHNWIAEQRITEQPIRECPACGGKAKRLISGGSGFALMGGGWYATGYDKKGRPNES